MMYTYTLQPTVGGSHSASSSCYVALVEIEVHMNQQCSFTHVQQTLSSQDCACVSIHAWCTCTAV
eukprot:14552-Heterococcus_DN1.PRE.1